MGYQKRWHSILVRAPRDASRVLAKDLGLLKLCWRYLMLDSAMFYQANVIAELAKSFSVTIVLDWSAKGTLLAYRLTCCWPFKCSALHDEVVIPSG